jgi:hypothetical protein
MAFLFEKDLFQVTLYKGPPGWGCVALEYQTSTVKRLLLRNPIRGGQGPNRAAEPYDDDDDDEPYTKELVIS